MGIPKYFRWLTKKYDNLIFDKVSRIDNLFLDTNCLIHPCVRKVLEDNTELIKDHNDNYLKNNNNICKNSDIYSKLEKKMFESIISYIYKLYIFTKPQKMLYIAIDGVAPRAKMEQQRKRRYRSYKEHMMKKDIYEKYGVSLKSWDTNNITPGTTFMLKLDSYLYKNLVKKFKNENITVKFSGSRVAGEGEHKIMSYLRSNENNCSDDINSIYGLDADLIMLSLFHKNIYLLREAIHINNIDTDSLLLFSIKNLKKNIITEVVAKIWCEDFEINEDSIITDYVVICFLLGNDFLPKLINLDINENSILELIDIYVNLINVKKNYLVIENRINFKFLQQLLNNLYLSEDKRLQNIQKSINKRYISYKGNTSMEKEIENINFYPLLKKKQMIYNQTTDISLGDENWQDKYYLYYFNIKNINLSKKYIETVSQTYLDGLQWNLLYYTSDCPDWKWFYPYPCAPCLRDLCQYLDNRIYIKAFEENIPFLPTEQLFFVIPKGSIKLLPKPYQQLFDNNNPEIKSNFPDDFQLDILNNIWFHECNPILPILIESHITKYTNVIKLDKFDNEKNKILKEIVIQ